MSLVQVCWKHCGNYEQFLAFPQCFQDLYQRHIRQGLFWERIKCKPWCYERICRVRCWCWPVIVKVFEGITRRQSFRLVQIERNCRQHFKVHLRLKNKCHIGKKTWWEKEKLLVKSNFSFFHRVFHSYISSVRQNVALCGSGLTLYSTDTHFDASTQKFLKTLWEKEKLLVTNNFSFLHNVFYSIR